MGNENNPAPIFGYQPKKKTNKVLVMLYHLALPIGMLLIVQSIGQVIGFVGMLFTEQGRALFSDFSVLMDPLALTRSLYASPVFVIGMTLSHVLTLIAYGLIVRFGEKNKLATMGLSFKSRSDKKKALIAYLRGFIIGFGMVAAVFGMLLLLGQIKVTGISLPTGQMALFIAMLLMWIPQGASEEVMMRGYMLPRLGASYHRVVAILVSSIYFAFLHALNPDVSLLAIINIALIGVFFAVLCLYTQELWTICALHTAWNLSMGSIFGFPVSGITAQASVVSIDVQDETAAWLGGHHFGPEGGLVVTAVMLVASAIVLLLSVKKKKRRVEAKI